MEKFEPTQELATVVQDETIQLEMFASDLDNASKKVIIGKEPQTEEEEKTVINSMVTAEQIEDLAGKNIEVVNYIANDTVLTDEEGKQQRRVRLVLITKDGKAYSTVSPSFYRSFLVFVSVKGKAETWEKPLKINVFKEQSKNNAMYKFLNCKLA